MVAKVTPRATPYLNNDGTFHLLKEKDEQDPNTVSDRDTMTLEKKIKAVWSTDEGKGTIASIATFVLFCLVVGSVIHQKIVLKVEKLDPGHIAFLIGCTALMLISEGIAVNYLPGDDRNSEDELDGTLREPLGWQG